MKAAQALLTGGMPPTKQTRDDRRVKRVTNAINNPTSSLLNLSEALDSVKHIRVYQDEIDAWILKAIDLQRYDMILEILGRRSRIPLAKGESLVLHAFIFKHPRYLAKFVASPAFHPDRPNNFEILCKTKDEDVHLLAKLFEFPRTGNLLESMRWIFSWRLYQQIFHKNPDIQRRIQQQKMLLRFWLLVVKRNLPAWKDSLYYPGSGPLYLKAFASFKRDMPCLLTCV